MKQLFLSSSITYRPGLNACKISFLLLHQHIKFNEGLFRAGCDECEYLKHEMQGIFYRARHIHCAEHLICFSIFGGSSVSKML